MKKAGKSRVIGTALNKRQRSTLELWQEHMAALTRASEPRDASPNDYHPVTEQSIESLRSHPYTG